MINMTLRNHLYDFNIIFQGGLGPPSVKKNNQNRLFQIQNLQWICLESPLNFLKIKSQIGFLLHVNDRGKLFLPPLSKFNFFQSQGGKKLTTKKNSNRKIHQRVQQFMHSFDTVFHAAGLDTNIYIYIYILVLVFI